MTDPTIAQSVLFPDLFDKPLVATFDREQSSSDGGAVLLKAAERVYGLVKAFGRCLIDRRAPEKVRHTLEDLVAHGVFGIACGHPDGARSGGLVPLIFDFFKKSLVIWGHRGLERCAVRTASPSRGSRRLFSST